MPTSFDSFYPFDAGTGSTLSEQQWSDMARLFVGDGVAANGLGSYDLNKLAVTADGGGMYVLVPSGRVQIKGHHAKLDTQETLAIAAAHATLGRLDRVVARLKWSDNLIELDVLTGTPHATPLTGLTALTQTDGTVWEIELARVTVGAAVSAISSGNVSDLRPYASSLLADSAVGTAKIEAGAISTISTVIGSGTLTTTSTGSFVAMADMTITLTTVAGSTLVVQFDAEASNDTLNQYCRPIVYVDGVQGSLLPGTQSAVANTFGRIGGHTVLTGLSAASHTIDIRWAVSGGTGSVASHRRLTVTEYKR